MRVSVVFYIIACLVLIGLAVPLIMEKVKPNSLYGFRTPKTFSSEEIWYEANRFSGWTLAIAGIASLVCFVVMAIAPGAIPFARYPIAQLVIFLAPLAVALLLSFLYLAKL